MPAYSLFHDKGQNPTASGETENLSDLFKSFFEIEVATTEEMVNKVFEVRFQGYCIDRAFEDPMQFPDKREQDAYSREFRRRLNEQESPTGVTASVKAFWCGV